MDKGWIKLHRRIREHWLYKEKRIFSRFEAWVDLLLEANHSDNRVPLGNEIIECKRGQTITSIRQLCDRWGWSNTKVINFLKLLQDDEMIMYFSDAKKTVITIVNYGFYQDRNVTETTQERRKNDARTTQKHTNKNDKNDKNDKEDIYIKSDSDNPTQPAQNTKADTTTPQERIFQRWNSKGIIQHRKLTDKIKRAINGSLQDYTEEEICRAIDNYATILADDRYYWSYKWGLREFLMRGLDKFLDFDVAAQNYRKDYREKQKLNKQTDFNKFEQHEYTADELESLFMKIGGG